MSNNFEEVYYVLEEALELAFQGKFVVRLYDYFQSRGVTKVEADQFLNSSTAKELADEVNELDEYIKGGKDNQHQQLREAYPVSYTHLTLPTKRIV